MSSSPRSTLPELLGLPSHTRPIRTACGCSVTDTLWLLDTAGETEAVKVSESP